MSKSIDYATRHTPSPESLSKADNVLLRRLGSPFILPHWSVTPVGASLIPRPLGIIVTCLLIAFSSVTLGFFGLFISAVSIANAQGPFHGVNIAVGIGTGITIAVAMLAIMFAIRRRSRE